MILKRTNLRPLHYHIFDANSEPLGTLLLSGRVGWILTGADARKRDRAIALLRNKLGDVPLTGHPESVKRFVTLTSADEVALALLATAR